jgi:hypothetical protein
MKIEITEKGVHNMNGERIAVGTVIEITGGKVPGHLVGKCVVMREHVAVTNPAMGAQPTTDDREALKTEGLRLGLDFPSNIPTDKLKAMIAEATAKIASGGKE